ncbi:rab family gtpase [Stylonychia lemnae]|uniref:Rab family gtpase n=1 Tax=Stylonychia lemnae TaxID=5949 RepID=A0A078AWR0_STYLE|nr:rab family gtpase [Stylonychia lemnae]|eukprot:CDW85248.1 rab family gtpase [Stylonychia lemnae]
MDTGKSSILLRFFNNIFLDTYTCTIGVDFKTKTLKVDEKIIKLQIWDTAGQERFKSISQSYYRNSNGCIAVYDITSRSSFDSVEEYIENFLAYSPKDVAQNIILVGNKSDMAEGRRKVSTEEAIALAERLNIAAVFETSAKDNESIDDLFNRAVVNCVDIQRKFASTNDSRNFSSYTSKARSEKIQTQRSFFNLGSRSEKISRFQNQNLVEDSEEESLEQNDASKSSVMLKQQFEKEKCNWGCSQKYPHLYQSNRDQADQQKYQLKGKQFLRKKACC